MAHLTYDPLRVYEGARPRLWGLAYRMLGSREDADDVVQETFVRWHQAPHHEISSPEAWLTTACTRLAIDALRRAHRRREEYVGPWLPEPVVSDGAAPEPLETLELAESLSTAFLLVLERLGPAERAAFLLHDVFDYDYAQVAAILGRSEPAVRQVVSRARKRVRGEETRFEMEPERQRALLDTFIAALQTGETAPLEHLLTVDVQFWSDGGGKVTAARNVIHGANNVARLLVGLGRKAAGTVHVAYAHVNGEPGLVVYLEGRVYATLELHASAEGRISRMFMVLNPEKLQHVGAASPPIVHTFGPGQPA